MLKKLGNSELQRELIFNLHGVGTVDHHIGADESFYWLSRKAFTSLLDHIVEARTKLVMPVFITFDDGNASDAAIALPELVRRGLHATFFVCARRIGAPHYLDRKALADLISAGMEIGTHGMDHRDWSELDEPTLDIELAEARQRIEDVCGKAVTKAAIPFGTYNRRLLMRLRREPFRTVYTSDGGLVRSDAWLKSRNSANRMWTNVDIHALLAGKQPLLPRLRQRLATTYKKLR